MTWLHLSPDAPLRLRRHQPRQDVVQPVAMRPHLRNESRRLLRRHALHHHLRDLPLRDLAVGVQLIRADSTGFVSVPSAASDTGRRMGELKRSTHHPMEAKLALCWSPVQITGGLRRRFPGDASMQITHEAIYLSLYDPRRRQAIDRSLTQRLRSGRPMRRPKIARRHTGRGIIRPPEQQ